MKSSKYLLTVTAILMVSTGLSAMEPIVWEPVPVQQNNRLVSDETQGIHRAGAAEEYLMAQPINVPNEQGQLKNIQLPANVAQQIAGYVGSERHQQKTSEIEYNNGLNKSTWLPFTAGMASIPMLAAAALTGNGKYLLAGSALLTSGLLGYRIADSKKNCHCTYAPANMCRHSLNANKIGWSLYGSFGGTFLGMPLACVFYPIFVASMARNEYKNEKHGADIIFGIKAASVPLVPLFAQRLSENTGSQWINGGMLAMAAFASYSGIKDLIQYKRSEFKSFDAFLTYHGNAQLKKEYQKISQPQAL